MDNYRLLRNQISQLSFEDSFAAAWAFSQCVQIKDFKFPKDVERHVRFTANMTFQPFPWQLETLMREVVRHAGDVCTRGRSLRKWNDTASVVNQLRKLEDEIHQQTLSQDNVLFEMLRTAHQQFPWQRRPNTRSVGRYFRIFSDPEIDEICRQLTGLSIHKIYALGCGMWGLYASKCFIKMPMTAGDFHFTQDEIDCFFRTFSEEVYSLRQKLKHWQVIDDTFSHDNRYLRAKPLIGFRVRGEMFAACPLPTLLYWRFTSGLYYDLTANPKFFNALGKSFQRYIGDVCTRALKGSAVHYLPEEKYGTRKASKDTVDWLLFDDQGAVFVECKTKRLSLDAKSNLVSQEALWGDVDILADAVVQLYKTILDYQNGLYPSLPFVEQRKVLPVVVTLENWYPLEGALGAELDRRIVDKLGERGLPIDVLTKLPYIVCSCEEFEEACQIIAKVGVDRFFNRRFDLKYNGWFLEDYMAEEFRAEHLASVDLFAESYDEILKPFL